MKQKSSSVSLLSIFVVVVLGSILTLSAFGVGLSIGSSNAAALLEPMLRPTPNAVSVRIEAKTTTMKILRKPTDVLFCFILHQL